ncbi:hypothetical protein D7X33_22255 [Butyricicoccus sp. 1XD8-22]|nr:hypothetical protein D7X33_22255 [Butyricicoccus sp. 1XD8-22]
MTNLNGKQVMDIINNELEYAIKATESSFRNKSFVVLEGDRIQSIQKTKRGAEGYIKKHTFSYYDEYFQEMREAGSNLYIVEICLLDIIDYYNTPSIWFTTLKNRWSRHQTNEYMLEKAEQMGVNEEVLKVIKYIIAESDFHSFPSYEMVFGKTEQVEEVQPEVIETVENTPENVEIEEITQDNTESNNTVQMKLNEEKNGIELYFDNKPSEEVRNLLKQNGFRWGKYNKCWYAKQSDKTLAIAQQLSNSETAPEEVAKVEYDRIEYVDITQFNIPENVEKRLIDNSLINNGRYVGIYTKELQGTLSRLKEATQKVLENTTDNYYHYRLVMSFNSFCKRYSEALNSYYYQSSVNPSWAVTGRGGLNVSRYNKKMDQIHNKLGKTVEIVNDFESLLEKYKYKMKKDQQRQIDNAVNQVDINSIKFETKTVNGKRVYIYDNYMINKNWSTFAVYDVKSGKELYRCKTTQKLEDAKKYVIYLVNQKDLQVV